jgi:hypothetical protein
MGVRTNIPGATAATGAGHHFVLQSAITGYSDEAYTNAKKLSSTGIVGDNPQIDTSSETFIGQVRWFKPMNPTINVASLTVATDGTPSTYGADYLTYIKTARTYGGQKVNLQSLITQQDGLAKIGRDFGEHRAQDEHNAILAVLKGVAISEALNGAAAASGATGLGGQTFENDPTDKKYGFYVDLTTNKLVGDATTTSQGAQRAAGFLNAFGMAYKDYEPEYAYLITSPEMMASLRSANLVDQDRVRDGNVEFNTIFQGKFRLIQTRASMMLSSAEMTKINTGAGVDIAGPKMSFIVLPGSIAMRQLSIEEPVEIERKAAAYMGGGSTAIWHRWGYVLMPAGYNWGGDPEAFPSDADYMKAVEGGTPTVLTSVASGTLADTTGTWIRKTNSALSLGILPVFHT